MKNRCNKIILLNWTVQSSLVQISEYYTQECIPLLQFIKLYRKPDVMKTTMGTHSGISVRHVRNHAPLCDKPRRSTSRNGEIATPAIELGIIDKHSRVVGCGGALNCQG